MKKSSVFKTRRQYYVAHVIGVVAIIAIGSWCTILAFDDNAFDLFPLLIAVVLLIALLQAVISFFSSMKSVEVTSKGLVISYLFQRHQNVIDFSEIKEMKTVSGKRVTSRVTDSFTLVLKDGRAFSFGRSQFEGWEKLREACRRGSGR